MTRRAMFVGGLMLFFVGSWLLTGMAVEHYLEAANSGALDDRSRVPSNMPLLVVDSSSGRISVMTWNELRAAFRENPRFQYSLLVPPGTGHLEQKSKDGPGVYTYIYFNGHDVADYHASKISDGRVLVEVALVKNIVVIRGMPAPGKARYVGRYEAAKEGMYPRYFSGTQLSEIWYLNLLYGSFITLALWFIARAVNRYLPDDMKLQGRVVTGSNGLIVVSAVLVLLVNTCQYVGFDGRLYEKRANQAEGKVNLGGIFTAATAFYGERKTYEVTDIHRLGMEQAGPYRYSLWYAVNGVPTRIPIDGDYAADLCDVTIPPASVTVTASATGFVAAAKGNVDDDAMCDEWSINEKKELLHTLDDTKD